MSTSKIVSHVLALAVVLMSTSASLADTDGVEKVVNGDFEQKTTGWSPFWSRDNAGTSSWDVAEIHSGKYSVRVEHGGKKDWSFGQTKRLSVTAGEIYELASWVRINGTGSATLGVILYGSEPSVMDWSFGGRTVRSAADWRLVKTRFLIPEGGKSIVARWTGSGPITMWMDDVSLKRVGSVDDYRVDDLPATVSSQSDFLEFTFDSERATFTVRDLRTGQRWTQHAGKPMVVLDAQAVEHGIDVRLLEPTTMLELSLVVRLEQNAPEVSIALNGSGVAEFPIDYPRAFRTQPGMLLIMPVNEGISYPVDDQSLSRMSYYLYGGHGLCMGWWGVTDGRQGMMAIVETPDDAVVDVPRRESLLCQQPRWMPQKGEFGDTRRMRYVFLDEGGYVAMCKRYRQFAKQIGRLKTLAEKREAIPAVDRLVGAVNVWCWERDPVGICTELQKAGIQRILWSNRSTPDTLKQLNEMGVLTSRYDIYQDVMDPANFPKLRGLHPDWTTAAWPDDLMLDADGQWVRGWRVKGKDGQMCPCGVLCDRRAVPYAQKRISAELKTHAYRSRFIDTTTASPWRECYHPDHPMTRTDSRLAKMELLRTISEQFHLVTGSETGHEAAVPFVHYFEGMLSLGPYRIPDAGRQMAKIWDTVPERVAKFQTGHFYRLPLWELVYHDCVVAQWYWGDYNNKLPSVWDRRDLINALYGTPPMFMFNRELWHTQRDRFVRSYQTATTIARATGYCEMLAHRWLTDDHSVQQTEFANGVRVTVNFGQQPYQLSDGTTLDSLGHRFEGLPVAQALQ